MSTLYIKLYNLLKNDFKVADDKAEEFVQVLNDIVHSDVKESVVEYKSVMKEDLARLETKMGLKVSDLRSDLRSEIKESKVDTIKWMVSLFIALAMMILGLYIKK
jgi:hypothetical protein